MHERERKNRDPERGRVCASCPVCDGCEVALQQYFLDDPGEMGSPALAWFNPLMGGDAFMLNSKYSMDFSGEL